MQAGTGQANQHWQTAYPRQGVLDFDRARKLTSVCCAHAGQSLIFTKGAPERLLPRCALAIDERGAASTEMTPAIRRDWEQLLERWGGDEALRCVGLAYSAVADNRKELTAEDEKGLVFLGVLGLQDPPRREVADAVQTCFTAGIRVVMLTGAPPGSLATMHHFLPCSAACACRVRAILSHVRTASTIMALHASLRSGDNQATANAIARAVGIAGADVNVSAALGMGNGTHAASMTAAEFDALPADAQRDAAAELRVLARVEPHHKSELVGALQAQHEVRAHA
jgi:magnesium-transporting ATPase (P-type)